MPDERQEMAEQIAESLTLNGTLGDMITAHEAKLAQNSEWSSPHHHHAHTLVTAFAVGVMTADPWFHGYKLPPDFASVIDWIAFNVQREYPAAVPQVSLFEMRQNYKRWAMEHPSYRQWNETPKMVGVVTRYTAVPDERDFIDLDVPPHNAALYLRQEHRESVRFDQDFAARQAFPSSQLPAPPTPEKP